MMLQNNNSDEEINYHLLGNTAKLPLNTMNLDELVKSVVAAEDSQSLQNPPSSSSSSSSSSTPASEMCPGNAKWKHATSLGKRTFAEEWNDTADDDQESSNVVNNIYLSCSRQEVNNVGETTLEEFLIRAGVLSLRNQESVTNPHSSHNPMVLVKQQVNDQWLQLQMELDQDHNQNQPNINNLPAVPIQAMPRWESHFQAPEIGFENQGLDVGFLDTRLDLSIGIQDAENTSISDPPIETAAERSMLRKQKRMIKNRESAARSRAKKQAHTKQLEQEVARLKADNYRIKKRQETETIVAGRSDLISKPRIQLRRTSSFPPAL